jgi:hypothetical protein
MYRFVSAYWTELLTLRVTYSERTKIAISMGPFSPSSSLICRILRLTRVTALCRIWLGLAVVPTKATFERQCPSAPRLASYVTRHFFAAHVRFLRPVVYTEKLLLKGGGSKNAPITDNLPNRCRTGTPRNRLVSRRQCFGYVSNRRLRRQLLQRTDSCRSGLRSLSRFRT